MMAWPATASGPTTARSSPEPSSSVIPIPSASELGEPITVPATATRTPSRGSPALPVAVEAAAGSAPIVPRWIALSASLRVRWENRLAIVPRNVTVVPAGQEPVAAASR